MRAVDLHFTPPKRGSDPDRTRTYNLRIKSAMLCQIELRGHAAELYQLAAMRQLS